MNKSDSTLKIISNSEDSQNLKLEFQSLTLETNIQDNCILHCADKDLDYWQILLRDMPDKIINQVLQRKCT